MQLAERTVRNHVHIVNELGPLYWGFGFQDQVVAMRPKGTFHLCAQALAEAPYMLWTVGGLWNKCPRWEFPKIGDPSIVL